MEYGGAAFGSLGESGVAYQHSNHHHQIGIGIGIGIGIEDFIDELLVDGCWLETTAAAGSYNFFMHPSCETTTTTTTTFLPDPSHHQHPVPVPQQHYYLQTSSSSSSSDQMMLMLMQQQDHSSDQETSCSVAGKRWWIGPTATDAADGAARVGNPTTTTTNTAASSSPSSSSSSSVKERLVVAVGYLKDYTNNTNVLIQIWVPPRRSALHHRINDNNDHIIHEAVATPNTNPNLVNVVRFLRSNEYPRLQYEEAARGSNNSNNLALPVFERGTGTCLGVLEFFLIASNNNNNNNNNNQSHMFNYHRPHHQQLLLDNNALEQGVDFRSCQNLIIPPAIKVFEELYQAAVNEIVEVLTSVCKTHSLPLALTWAPCIQQGAKCACCAHHDHIISSSSSSSCCLSTLDSACFVADLDTLAFQEACSDCHLFRGQGIVGTAFTTKKPCFAMDIRAFSKAEYPLSQHAKMFGLHAAVAIPLRSVYTGSAADFVVEFFLPRDCHDSEEQKHMLNSLSMVVQQACRSLHVPTSNGTTDQQLQDEEEDFTLLPPTHDHDHDHDHKQMFAAHQMELAEEEEEGEEANKVTTTSSWIAHMMETQGQQKGKGVVCVSLEDQHPKEEFKVTTNWDTTTTTDHLHFSDFARIDTFHEQSSGGSGSLGSLGSRSRASVEALDQQESYAAFGSRRSSSSAAASGGRKSGDKRRTKAEKTISLPVLRQYFAGSLKDAAKSIGVCPTTLKRICRQHGISRWPSRTIKKVGHSLKKLQLEIDSVQGAEGAIQIGSFYTSFPELSSADFSSSSATGARSDHSSSKKKVLRNTLKSAASACSQQQANCTLMMMNSSSSLAAGEGCDASEEAALALLKSEVVAAAAAAAELQHASSSLQEDKKKTKQHFTRSSKTHSQQPADPMSETNSTAWNSSSSSPPLRDCRVHNAFRVKATFVDEKIRFSLQPNWGFRDLQVEIARRFNLNDINNMDLKYLDEDGEWVLLACDADFDECKDIHTSSQSRTIRLSLFHPNT